MSLNNEITVEYKEGYAVLTIDSPQTRNALSVSAIEHIDKLIDKVMVNNDIRALLITGGGEKSFIAGADISKLVEMTAEEARYSIEVGHALFSKIERLPIPVVAVINGYCLGGGLEIAMCCDIRICSANAKFGLPEINVGMIPGWGGTLRLPRLIGESRAKNLIYRGKIFDAKEALDYGLVVEMYDDVATLRAKAEELASDLAAKPPIIMKMNKQLVYDASNKQPTDIAQRDALALGFAYTTHDSIEGLKAFLEKRRPIYKGM